MCVLWVDRWINANMAVWTCSSACWTLLLSVHEWFADCFVLIHLIGFPRRYRDCEEPAQIVKYTINPVVILKSLSHLFQYVAPLLDGRLSLPVVVPIRTKKRHFIPPAVNVKTKTQAEQEAQARASGVVVRQEYMERAINIACTGAHWA